MYGSFFFVCKKIVYTFACKSLISYNVRTYVQVFSGKNQAAS